MKRRDEILPFFLYNFVMKTFILIASAILASALDAQEHKIYTLFPKDKFSNQKEKNGIVLNEVLRDFEKRFRFVSAHYREDKFEIRLIYGNKSAMEGLKDKNFAYKDGAIFYKVVYNTEHDPNFRASLIPESQPIVRQIMVRDAKRFKKSNGWGYAVFTERGETLPGDPDATLETCYACHALVHPRNDVFSIPMETIVPNDKIPSVHYTKDNKPLNKKLSDSLFKFRTGDFKELNSDLRSLINQKTTKVNFLTGDILKMDFSGFMTELNSFLIKETQKNGFPSVALRTFNNQLLFSYSFIDMEAEDCKGKGEKLVRFGWGKKADALEKNSYVTMKRCFKNP